MLFPVSLCLAQHRLFSVVWVWAEAKEEREVACGVQLGGGQGKFVSPRDEPLCLTALFSQIILSMICIFLCVYVYISMSLQKNGLFVHASKSSNKQVIWLLMKHPSSSADNLLWTKIGGEKSRFLLLIIMYWQLKTCSLLTRKSSQYGPLDSWNCILMKNHAWLQYV